jgi:hypothetical protein
MEDIEWIGTEGVLTPGCPFVSGVGIVVDTNWFIPERNVVDVMGDLESSKEVSHASAKRRNI